MLTLYHAPYSRATRIIALIAELDIWDQIDIHTVSVARADGTGGADPANPHPDGKVPVLVHDGVEIRETIAIMLYLTDLFPQAGFAPITGDKDRGSYLSWLAWYAGVMEPVYVAVAAQVEHPIFHATFRGVAEVVAVLKSQLSETPYLLGDSYSAADLLVVSPYQWFQDGVPDDPVIKDWVARCTAQNSHAVAGRYDAGLTAKAIVG
ncbi:glutathione S-transferase family protein [Loktanella agnita]|uniref:glutathione S-transferase family protein n=1 Tax=Loktanella agnita TaxID=287097 RepID=UPI003987E873